MTSTDLLDAGTPAGALFYLAGNVGLTAWMRRADFRRGGRAAALAWLDVLCNAGMTMPALAYWDKDVATRLGDWPLRLLFVLGLAGLCGFAIHDARVMLGDARLALKLRRRFALIGACAALLPSAPEVWWGASALLHIDGSA